MTNSKKKKGILDKTGEVIERLGEKISDAGATRIGRTVSNLGDSIERTQSSNPKPSGQNRS